MFFTVIQRPFKGISLAEASSSAESWAERGKVVGEEQLRLSWQPSAAVTAATLETSDLKNLCKSL